MKNEKQNKNQNKMVITLIMILIIIIMNFISSYSQEIDKIKSLITIQGHNITAEISDTEKTREKGLMWRNQLGKNEGMLFIYNDSATRCFWMKNTFIALDMAFIDSNKVIRTIHTAKTVNDSTTFYSSYVPVKYVLEVNSGWFEEHGISLGDTVLFSHPPIPNGNESIKKNNQQPARARDLHQAEAQKHR
ncbi:DUF192 domain-containing protein [Prosthecochloris sp.]|uniref:DUF192 domain-containing protein n=1 Tax=Prosthecochloris sp. TaxID=290513 RepID=UPI00257F1133|nr:DUF192 domain-containing protein [Prosthecochloris sp.]